MHSCGNYFVPETAGKVKKEVLLALNPSLMSK